MSLATYSPVCSSSNHSSSNHSSSSDDYASFLEGELDSTSSDSPNQNIDDEYDPEIERLKRRKVELESIEEPQDSTTYRSLDQKLEASSSIKKDICTHPGFFGDMCICCGQRKGDKSDDQCGVTFKYIHKGLRLGNDEIVRLRNRDMKNLLRHKKLYLVLDLDHTLLNSTELKDMTSEEQYLNSREDSLQGTLFKLNSMPMMTKLRPYVHTFLKEANLMFEMYIYTMGDRIYAAQMVDLLDPQKEYFSSRVISRDESTQKHQKGLDLVLGQESAVIILDDTERAWPKFKENLIVMERYSFFASSCRQFGYNCKSLAESKNDESEPDGALATVLKVLRRIHFLFFDEIGDDLAGRDVRQVLQRVRREVLSGCKILFSRVFPMKSVAEKQPLWKLAEQLGATCTTEIDISVTHVVSTDVGTEKSRWAVKKNKFIVHPNWIEAAYYLWEKQPEDNFCIIEKKNKE